jgi:hypothetical protein
VADPTLEIPAALPVQVKRKRGRPRKIKAMTPIPKATDEDENEGADTCTSMASSGCSVRITATERQRAEDMQQDSEGGGGGGKSHGSQDTTQTSPKIIRSGGPKGNTKMMQGEAKPRHGPDYFDEGGVGDQKRMGNDQFLREEGEEEAQVSETTSNSETAAGSSLSSIRRRRQHQANIAMDECLDEVEPEDELTRNEAPDAISLQSSEQEHYMAKLEDPQNLGKAATGGEVKMETGPIKEADENRIDRRREEEDHKLVVAATGAAASRTSSSSPLPPSVMTKSGRKVIRRSSAASSSALTSTPPLLKPVVSTAATPLLSEKMRLFELSSPVSYEAGSLVWARIGVSPYWPSVVVADPDLDIATRIVPKGAFLSRQYHVQFFGKIVQRAWIASAGIMSYSGIEEFSNKAQMVKKEHGKSKTKQKYVKAFFAKGKTKSLWEEALKGNYQLITAGRFKTYKNSFLLILQKPKIVRTRVQPRRLFTCVTCLKRLRQLEQRGNASLTVI